LDNARFAIEKKLKTPLNFFFQNALQNVAVISQHSCSLQRTGTILHFVEEEEITNKIMPKNASRNKRRRSLYDFFS